MEVRFLDRCSAMAATGLFSLVAMITVLVKLIYSFYIYEHGVCSSMAS